MNAWFLMIHSNLKKSKGQTISIVMLMFLASIMLHLFLILFMDYKQNFIRYHEALNAEHVTLAIKKTKQELEPFLVETLEKDARTDQYEIDDVKVASGSFAYNGGEIKADFVCLEKEEAKKRLIGTVEIVEDSNYTSGVYLPLIYGMDNQISVGTDIKITLNNKEVTYKVCGFINSIMAGSHNCGVTMILFTEDLYGQLEEQGLADKGTFVSVRLTDKNEGESFQTMLNERISSQFPSTLMQGGFYEQVELARYTSQTMCSAIMIVASGIILFVTLVVIFSNITNYIQEEMKHLGVLKAMGYKSNQIIGMLLLQFLSISGVTTLLGIGSSYVLFPFINTMLIAQTGIPYHVHFLFLPFIITMVTIGGTVTITVLLSASRIKKITPIMALRQGTKTHSFQKNHLPLERTNLPLSIALSLKTALLEKKQTIILSITMMILTLVVVFTSVMVENVIIDIEVFINLIMGESADSIIVVKEENEQELLQGIREDERVKSYYLYHMLDVSHVGGTKLVTIVSDDFSNLKNQDMCIKGRFPKYENEVAIGIKYANDKGLHLGDEITISVSGKEQTYLISGLTQFASALGKDCLMTRSGYQRLEHLTTITYYIQLQDEVDIDTFHTDMQNKLSTHLIDVINGKATYQGMLSAYITFVTMIVVGLIVLSTFIVSFVLYLLVRVMLNKKKREYGIMKAFGVTTKQLILQTAISFLPIQILATGVGVVISCCIVNPLFSFMLSEIGIVICHFAIPVGMIIIVSICMIALSFVLVCMLSRKIKKISPKELLMGE